MEVSACSGFETRGVENNYFLSLSPFIVQFIITKGLNSTPNYGSINAPVYVINFLYAMGDN